MDVIGRLFHLLGAIAMLVGLFLPLIDAGRATASPSRQDDPALVQNQDVNATSFTRVAVIGDFQQQFGCSFFDPDCPATQLTNHDGIWTGVFPIPPGEWEWQIVATTQDGQEVVLSESGLNQTDTVLIADTDTGVFFSFNALRQEAEALPVASIATLSTDVGVYALRPDNGDFVAIIQTQGSPLNAELQLDGVPVGNPQVIQPNQGPLRVTLDATGTIVDTEDLGYGTLSIRRVDGATGEPLAGGCYEVRQGNTVVNRGCDSDDGTADGSVLLRFPEGLEPGSYTVAEVTAPEGGEQAPEQDLDLQQTDNSIEIITGEAAEEPTAPDGGIVPIDDEATETPQEGVATETPADDIDQATETADEAIPGDLIVTLQDQNGQPIGGACFQLLRDGDVVAESCDSNDAFPNNGNSGFFGVPSGTYTLHQSTALPGIDAVPDQDVEVPAGGERTVMVQVPASAEPTVVSTGDIVVLRQDEQGNPVGGACFELIDRDGQAVGNVVCDEDGDVADDGRIGFFDVPAGTYTLRESRTPEGYAPASDASIEVTGDQAIEVAVQGATVATEAPTGEPTAVPTQVPTEEITTEPTAELTPTESPTEAAVPGSLIITLHDQNDQPIGGACFELRQGEIVIGPICDSDDPFPGNGNTGFFGQPSGSYTLHQTTVPEGTEPVADQEVDIRAGGEDIVVVKAPAGAATEEPTATTEASGGDVVIDIAGLDQSADQVCVELNTSGGISLIDAPAACDNGVGDAEPAPEQIRIADVPEGEYGVFVTRGPDELVEADPQQVAVVEGEEAEVTIAAQAVETVATETPQPTPTPEPGILPVIAVNAAGEPLPGACWTLTGNDSDRGPLCDDGVNGGIPDDGQVQFEDLVVGTYTLAQTQAPEGYQPVEPLPVDVAAGENPAFEVMHEAVVSSVEITTVNADGASLSGACYAMDGGEPICDDGEGMVTFEAVALGEHMVVQTTTPEGHEPAAGQTVSVTSAEPVLVTFQNVPQTGSISIEVVDPDGNPVPGACFSIDGGEQRCDDDASDMETTSGTARVDGVAIGDHTVTLQSVPEDFQLPADSMGTTVEVDTVAAVRFELARLAPTTGSLEVSVQLETGDLVPEVCVTLTNTADGSVMGPICDNAEGDTNARPGVIGIDGIVVGAWNVAVSDGTEIPGGDVSGADPRSVEILAGERSAALLSIPVLPENGTVRIVTTNGTTNLDGACYDLAGPDASVSVCDNDETTDNDGTGGVIEVLDAAPGTWTVTMSAAPAGFAPAPATDVIVTAGETASVEVVLTAIEAPGSLMVNKVDEAGEPLAGSCFAVQQGGMTVVSACDESDASPNDGVLVFTDLDAGSYQLVETRAPSNQYQRAEPQTVEIVAGEETTISVTNTQRAGSLFVITVPQEEPTRRLFNACYLLDGVSVYGPFCDRDDGTVDGRTSFVNVIPGDYTLTQTVAPTANDGTVGSRGSVGRVFGNDSRWAQTGVGQTLDGRSSVINTSAGGYGLAQDAGASGYELAPDRQVTIVVGSSLQVTIQNVAAPPPAETGWLVVIPLDEKGTEVSGGCYQVFSSDLPVTGRVCDNADDVDKRIIFRGLPVGTYTVRELLAPSPAFVIAANQEVTIRLNERTNARFAHTLKAGRVVVQAVNTLGQSLQGACFDLADDGQEPACTGPAGDVLFSNVPAGVHTMTQTQAPHGYRLNEEARSLSVSPGQTTVVQVVFETAPPPDTGSVQVQKFICPAGKDGNRTQFLGGAQGNAQLARTAGCTQGSATFTLVAEDGSGNGPGEFSTGHDGRYQVTVTQGLYVLTETNPDLPGSSSAQLRVGIGQMTTVIVINYVAPPEPAPASIDVTSYTCPPSFNGTSYRDFAESCTGDQALTNNLTVRVEGAQTYKRVTGDTGQLGVTRFTDLPAGKYEIHGEKPYNIPIMYLFCGTNADNPADVKTINGAVPLALGDGQTVTCRFFQVPEQLSREKGGILIQKFSCPIDKPAKGYDWATECERSTRQIPFSLDIFNREMQEFEPLREVAANPDGLVRFPDLSPGTYKLEEVGAKWCFAQSNSVNADGNIVVQPNRLAEVWIYNCVGTSQPPNTGSGDAAAVLDPVENGNTGSMMLLGFVWPAIALVGWLGWRARHSSHSPVLVRRENNHAA